MIDKEAFSGAGLTNNEAEIYLILLNLGEASIYSIADQTKISRPNIYDVMKKLVEKSLAISITKNGRKIYKPANPESLINIVKEKEKNLTQLLPNLLQIYNNKKSKPLIEIFEGNDGFKNVVTDMSNSKKDIWIYNGADTRYILKYLPDFYLKRYLNEKKKTGVTTRILYSKGVKPVNGPGYKLKLLPDENLSCVSYWIYGNVVAIGIWSDLPIIIKITDENIAKVYEKNISMIWNMIK